jgi:hypothetical protein
VVDAFLEICGGWTRKAADRRKFANDGPGPYFGEMVQFETTAAVRVSDRPHTKRKVLSPRGELVQFSWTRGDWDVDTSETGQSEGFLTVCPVTAHPRSPFRP